MSCALDVTGLGNAIVDVVASTDDLTLHRLGMTKAGMALIDEARSIHLRGVMRSPVKASGGSVANSIAGLASLGAKVGYIGKTCNDELGQIFRQDLFKDNVHYTTPARPVGPPTSHSLIFVTPDAQRTMNTYLGASLGLAVRDLDRDMIEASGILYLEGYLFDAPTALEAFHAAARIARGAGRRVALSLSDAGCVRRHRQAFLRMIETSVDILLANEEEATALLDGATSDEAIAAIGKKVAIAAVTRGASGSVIIKDGREIAIPAAKPRAVIDTTGAGDLYASGILYGLAKQWSPEECAWMGSLAAAEVISHYGGRPLASLKDYVASRWSAMPLSARHAHVCRAR